MIHFDSIVVLTTIVVGTFVLFFSVTVNDFPKHKKIGLALALLIIVFMNNHVYMPEKYYYGPYSEYLKIDKTRLSW